MSDPRKLASEVPTLYSLHITQIHHAAEIEAIKKSAQLQQNALDEINGGIKWLNRLVLAALIVALLKFMLTGGFSA